MKILVPDTLSELEVMLTVRMRARERQELAQPVFREEGGMFTALNVLMNEKARGGYEVLAAAQLEGFDVLAGQQGWGLFNPTRSPEASAWALQRLREAHVLEQTRLTLERCAQALTGLALPESTSCYVIPADPANRNLMVRNRGLSVFGRLPGWVLIEVWPSEDNLERLGPELARAFHQGVRLACVPWGDSPTLADYLAVEGLSACFADSLFGEGRAGPWHPQPQAAERWQATLEEVARMSGAPSLEEMQTNVYGMRVSMSPSAVQPPPPAPMDQEELTYSVSVLREALEETAPGRIAAYLYGDALVAPQGYAAVGLSPYVGLAVAWRMARDFLARTSIPLTAATAANTGTILKRSGWFS